MQLQHLKYPGQASSRAAVAQLQRSLRPGTPYAIARTLDEQIRVGDQIRDVRYSLCLSVS